MTKQSKALLQSNCFLRHPCLIAREGKYCRNGPTRQLFGYFLPFQQQFNKNIVDFYGCRTRIVGVEGDHADHLTTTAQEETFVSQKIVKRGIEKSIRSKLDLIGEKTKK